MKRFHLQAIVAAVAVAASGAALADITIGVVAPLTGPASGLGIPAGNQVKIWPKEIAGEKLNVILLDDASDPTNGV
ncbi:MAG: branched-chain amino acid ABC transporter substrate-binding protein, partial [Burkholderiales bacterium]|nr:branched-chain amino acid ABC transporter substrate-binding protein [Burkholderiales bacterium]